MEPTQTAEPTIVPENEQESVDLCFMLDCTGSMQSYINMARNRVQEVIVKVQEEYPESQIKIGIVAYRDIGDNKRFEIFPFEASPDKAKNFLAALRADGGNDTPEDVNGAFQKVLFEMDWKNPVRLLVHIADAPCHGKEFHSADDNHPQGYKEDMDWDKIFKELVEKRLDYMFIKILPVTDKMFEKFRAYAEKHGSLEAEVSFQQEQIPVSAGGQSYGMDDCYGEEEECEGGLFDDDCSFSARASASGDAKTEECFVDKVSKGVKAAVAKKKAKK